MKFPGHRGIRGGLIIKLIEIFSIKILQRNVGFATMMIYNNAREKEKIFAELDLKKETVNLTVMIDENEYNIPKFYKKFVCKLTDFDNLESAQAVINAKLEETRIAKVEYENDSAGRAIEVLNSLHNAVSIAYGDTRWK